MMKRSVWHASMWKAFLISGRTAGITRAEHEIMAMLLRRIDFVNRMALRVDRGHAADLVRARLEMRDQLAAKRGAEYAGNMQDRRGKNHVLRGFARQGGQGSERHFGRARFVGIDHCDHARAAIHDDDGGLPAAEAPANKDVGFAKNDARAAQGGLAIFARARALHIDERDDIRLVRREIDE